MPYSVVLARSAQKDIKKLPPLIQKRLRLKLEFFISQPDLLAFAEPLKKPADAQYRFRVGAYRVLFDMEKSTIVILHVQHRRGAENYVSHFG